MKRPLGEADDSLIRVRSMRQDATPAEKKLWQLLRGRKLSGIKFRRQVWIGRYIADFVAIESKMIIEIDGDTHGRQKNYDDRRTAFLAGEGFSVIRFSNSEVMINIEGVVQMIDMKLKKSGVPSPSHAAHGPLPLPQGERGL